MATKYFFCVQRWKPWYFILHVLRSIYKKIMEVRSFCSPKLQGKYIFWEFATDYYDVGFGLYFEWTVAPSTAISVHVSDSSEDEEEYEGEGDGGRCSTNMPSLLMSCFRNLVHHKKMGFQYFPCDYVLHRYFWFLNFICVSENAFSRNSVVARQVIISPFRIPTSRTFVLRY